MRSEETHQKPPNRPNSDAHDETCAYTQRESVDGIPFDDFGGGGPLLHFAHANGYPPGCYRRFLSVLRQQYRILAVRHRPLWPGSSPDELQHWNLIAEDMLRLLGTRHGDARHSDARYSDAPGSGAPPDPASGGAEAPQVPLIGVGHSLGAVTSLLAAARARDLFDALVLIDPVFLEPQLLERLYSDPKRSARLPLIRRTLMRREHFADPRDAFDHFRPKAVFARWPDAVLQDYVQAALRPLEGEYTLAYPREWEARVYSLPPREVWDLLPTITTPTLALRGADSETLTPAAWQLWQQRQPGATFVELPDSGHLLPMERPKQVAETVLNWLKHSLGLRHRS